MSDTAGAAGRWMFAVVVSVCLHVVVVGLFVVPGCDAGGTSESPAPVESPSSEPTENPEPSPETEPVTPPRTDPPTTSDASAAGAVRTAAPPTVADPAPRETPDVYVVRAGDTLTKIAKKHGTTPEALAEINGKTVRAMNILLVGQKIKLRK